MRLSLSIYLSNKSDKIILSLLSYLSYRISLLSYRIYLSIYLSIYLILSLLSSGSKKDRF